MEKRVNGTLRTSGPRRIEVRTSTSRATRPSPTLQSKASDWPTRLVAPYIGLLVQLLLLVIIDKGHIERARANNTPTAPHTMKIRNLKTKKRQ